MMVLVLVVIVCLVVVVPVTLMVTEMMAMVLEVETGQLEYRLCTYCAEASHTFTHVPSQQPVKGFIITPLCR